MKDHEQDCCVLDGHCTCGEDNGHWRSQLKDAHEELKATRFALVFMGVMWLVTLACVILIVGK